MCAISEILRPDQIANLTLYAQGQYLWECVNDLIPSEAIEVFGGIHEAALGTLECLETMADWPEIAGCFSDPVLTVETFLESQQR